MARRFVSSRVGKIFEMARVDFIPPDSQKTIEVYVHTDDPGAIPHFHVRKHGSHGRFDWETCILFEGPKYFLHGEYKDKLPRDVKGQLDKMLRQEDKKNRGQTYWESAIRRWNENNSNRDLSIDLCQPDYFLLK